MNAMGIDLGGSGFRIGVFDTTTGALKESLNGINTHRQRRPTPCCPRWRLSWPIWVGEGPIGMGFPGAVEAHSPITAPNLGQRGPQRT